jgi:hypothetical protein
MLACVTNGELSPALRGNSVRISSTGPRSVTLRPQSYLAFFLNRLSSWTAGRLSHLLRVGRLQNIDFEHIRASSRLPPHRGSVRIVFLKPWSSNARTSRSSRNKSPSIRQRRLSMPSPLPAHPLQPRFRGHENAVDLSLPPRRRAWPADKVAEFLKSMRR